MITETTELFLGHFHDKHFHDTHTHTHTLTKTT